MRHLNINDVELLKAQGCMAQDWNDILVDDDTDLRFVQNVSFLGRVLIHGLSGHFSLPDGRVLHSGLYNASLFNCVVGNNAYVSNVHDVISNCSISDDVFISNVDSISCTPGARFGNGTRVAVLNEAGGREIPICNLSSSQVAFMLTCMRHDALLVDRLERMVADYVDAQQADFCTVGRGARIMNSGKILNTNIGEYAVVDGVAYLVNGTVLSSSKAPTFVGDGVRAKDFIFCSNVEVSDGAIIERCFVGQGSQVGKSFSATDVFFCCNCQAFHGEADSVFAGPYTVTHHKGSLLIAGMYSFMNVGSSSNQSNHAYKLGPIHQGWLQRGCKLASGSHLIWPAQIGAFSMIMGHVANHPDTLDLPFSYLIEEGGRLTLVPAVALRSAGLVRDAQKWPKRDRRTDDSDLLDKLTFSVFSPYTVKAMIDGVRTLQRLLEQCGADDEVVYQKMHIGRSAILRGIDLYKNAIGKFVGDVIVNRLDSDYQLSYGMVAEALKPTVDMHLDGDWVDFGGLFLPKNVVDSLVDCIKSDDSITISVLVNDLMNRLYSAFGSWQWNWVLQTFGIDGVASLRPVLSYWKDCADSFDHDLLRDASKEFSPQSMLSYGVEYPEHKADDFANVHGEYDTCSFVRLVQSHMAKNQARFDKLMDVI